MELLLTDLKILVKVSVKKTCNPAHIFRFAGRRIYSRIIKYLDLKADSAAAKGFPVKYLSVVLSRQCGV